MIVNVLGGAFAAGEVYRPHDAVRAIGTIDGSRPRLPIFYCLRPHSGDDWHDRHRRGECDHGRRSNSSIDRELGLVIDFLADWLLGRRGGAIFSPANRQKEPAKRRQRFLLNGSFQGAARAEWIDGDTANSPSPGMQRIVRA